ncbi:MAG: hypothetical protein KA967_02415 [Methanoculleus sp.]|nr:hypothetical protein [Methanoculleus sp.]
MASRLNASSEEGIQCKHHNDDVLGRPMAAIAAFTSATCAPGIHGAAPRRLSKDHREGAHDEGRDHLLLFPLPLVVIPGKHRFSCSCVDPHRDDLEDAYV